MAERGILFSGALIGPLLSGTKTVTRRIVKWPVLSKSDGVKRRVFNESDAAHINDLLSTPHKHPTRRISCPYGLPNEMLWVRETFCIASEEATEEWEQLGKDGRPRVDGRWCFYRATDDGVVNGEDEDRSPWKPSIFMPRWASRITLQIDDARVERLQDITEEDARGEGVEPNKSFRSDPFTATAWGPHRSGFLKKWNELHGAGSWDANPWIWRIAFHRVDQAQRKVAAR